LTDSLSDQQVEEGTSARAWEVSPYIVFGLAGFTLYLTWMFMLYVSPALAPENILATLNLYPTTASDLSASLRFAQMIALWLTLLLGWRCSNAFSGRRGIVAMLVGSLMLHGLGVVLLLLIGLLPTGPDIITTPANGSLDSMAPVLWSGPYALPANIMAYAALALIGVSQGLMVMLWSSFMSMIGEHRILLFTALCVCCATLLTLLMTFLQPGAAVWICFTLSWLSMGCFAFIHFSLGETPKSLQVKAAQSDKRFNIHIKSTISVILYSIAIGFATCFIVYFDVFHDGLRLGALSACAAVLVASLVVALDASRFHRITESLLVKLHMPAIIIGIAPMFFDIMALKVAGCVFMLCFFMIVYIVNLSALAEHVRIERLNCIRVFGFGRAGNAFGFAVGAFAAWLAFQAPRPALFATLESWQTWVNIIMLVLLVVFVMGASFIFEDHYPSTVNGKPAEPKPPTQHPLPGGDLRTLSNYMLSSAADAQTLQAGIWKRRISALSCEYGLSPKETEVLFLLAKGRNAEYIQNELVVSRHTAKAHIYHIYQKTGVHSRQDLINMLEDVNVEPV